MCGNKELLAPLAQEKQGKKDASKREGKCKIFIHLHRSFIFIRS